MLLVIVALFASAFGVIYPPDSTRFGRQGLRLGLDLRGGTHLIYEADLSKIEGTKADAMSGAIGIIQRRANAYGVTEPIIQKQGGDRILVQLPGVRNIDEAVKLIGETAFLDFRWVELDEEGKPMLLDKQKQQPKWVPATGVIDGETKQLTGKYLVNAEAYIPEHESTFDVLFEWNDEGAKLFEEITKYLYEERKMATFAHWGKRLGIFLDNECISSPEVQAVIKKRGRITGIKSWDEAKVLAIELKSGALPIPLSLIQQQDVDPTLGADSIKKSVLAGSIGLGLILLFMMLYYRLPGVLACLSLLIYATLVLAIFKLVPVTLTLAGIAGFIISLGMAVDANVLIFERMKEELHGGRTSGAAVEAGFDRAWTAIRDSNITTFIVCAILYWFGSRFAATQVMGFALTLFIGVAVSMFTAIVVTRTLLRLFSGTEVAKRLWLFRAE
jgi:preprotein translocase subunit SecD